jgi:hypothetical protein
MPDTSKQSEQILSSLQSLKMPAMNKNSSANRYWNQKRKREGGNDEDKEISEELQFRGDGHCCAECLDTNM